MQFLRDFFASSPLSLIGQILGILAMVASVISYQMKTHKSIMWVQIVTAALFAASYALLGGWTAFALNAAAIVRNIVFLHQEDNRICAWRGWTVVFSAVMVLFGIISWEGYSSLFFMSAMVLNTISMSMHEPQSVRRVILFASPLAFTYNLLTGSVGGLINEVLAECSAIIGLIRYRKKGEAESDK